jgi:serine/threonine-protein kinase
MAEAKRPSSTGHAEQAPTVAHARMLEKSGSVDAAASAYLAAGATEDAARVLVQLRRFREAGDALLKATGVGPSDVGTLAPGPRKLALQAAICFGRAGDARLAAVLFVALGERDRAVEILRKSGDESAAHRVEAGDAIGVPAASATVGIRAVNVAEALEANGQYEVALTGYRDAGKPQHAARMAMRLERYPQAGELFDQAGMNLQAAEAFDLAGDARRGLDAALKVDRGDPGYRAAATLALRLASALDALDFQLDHFVAPFLATAPKNDRECEAFYLAGRLFAANDLAGNAEDAFARVLAVDPGFRDARTRYLELKAADRGSALQFERVLREDEAFRQATDTLVSPPPGVPDLPELPGLPAVPTPPRLRPLAGGLTGASRAGPRTALTTALRAGTISDRTSEVAPGQTRQTPMSHLTAEDGLSQTNPDLERDLVPGAVIADRYRIEAQIGQGGMAIVYSALDLELNARIAIKVFQQPLTDETLLARFKQEVLLSRQLQHVNIVRLYDIASVRGHRVLTMELLEGADLRSKLDAVLPFREGIGYLLQCCAALEHAHGNGVVHRDVKPANVFLTNDGVIKLMDFGIAKRQATPGLTVVGSIAGTPEYMSPEQISGFDKVGPSTDLYALGVMTYKFFTGVVPFSHQEIMPLLMMHTTETPVNPRARNPAIPQPLSEIIMRLLEKNPADRFATCEALASALRSVPV